VLSDPNTAIVRVGDIAMVDDAPKPVSGPSALPVAEAPKPKQKQKSYRVRSGETLTAISKKFQCDTRELAQANKIKAPRFAIKPGQVLTLEGCTAN
jgi:membrane-bound lytic murein transglycosylase D